MDLFNFAHKDSPEGQPLAERLRPRTLEEMLGQSKIVGANAPWRRLVESGQVPSLILWGPPGTGKTTLALLLAEKVDAEFISVNAVETGAKALRELGEAGRRRRLERRRKTLLFVDEIHRLNKGQQDVLLPFIEKGDLTLVGATTENPSYEINSALLSRCRILVFERLGEKELGQLAEKAANESKTSLSNILDPSGRERLIEYADGDGRRILNLMEVLLNLYKDFQLSQSVPSDPAQASGQASEEDADKDLDSDQNLAKATHPDQVNSLATDSSPQNQAQDHLDAQPSSDQGDDSDEVLLAAQRLKWPLSAEALSLVLDVPSLRYDKTADEHYDTVSAFIKSVRGSDPDAAVYYLARMIKGGEDPVFIARRLVILASEDIGNADPRALTVAISGLQAVELVGWPEAAISLAQVTTYLASAPKSNRSYLALRAAQELVEKTGTVPVPMALRSAKTSTMKKLGYGKGYRYSHDGEKGYLPQRFLPPELGDVKLYEPTDHGFEKNIRQYLAWLKS